MSVRLNHEAFRTNETTNERKGTLYSTVCLPLRWISSVEEMSGCAVKVRDS
jgi:hypothetical protein